MLFYRLNPVNIRQKTEWLLNLNFYFKNNFIVKYKPLKYTKLTAYLEVFFLILFLNLLFTGICILYFNSIPSSVTTGFVTFHFPFTL